VRLRENSGKSVENRAKKGDSIKFSFKISDSLCYNAKIIFFA
jgi:hypothetical protein